MFVAKVTNKIESTKQKPIILYILRQNALCQPLQQPGQRQTDGYEQQKRRHVAQLQRREVAQHKLRMHQVDFQADAADEREGFKKSPTPDPSPKGEGSDMPAGSNQGMNVSTPLSLRGGVGGEAPAHQHHAADAQRDIHHALQEQREVAAPVVLKLDAHPQRQTEGDEQQPHSRWLYRLLLLHQFAAVDTDEEDGYAAPEYLDMSHRVVYRGHILHHHGPHHRHDGHPSVDGMAAYQLHIERGKHIHRHDRRDEPEGPVVDAPEAPVHQDVRHEMPHVGTLRAVPIGSRGIVELSEQVGAEEVGDIIQAGDDDPRGIDAQQALAVEGTYSRRCGGAGARRCEITVRGCGGAEVRRCEINVWRFVAILVPPYPRTPDKSPRSSKHFSSTRTTGRCRSGRETCPHRYCPGEPDRTSVRLWPSERGKTSRRAWPVPSVPHDSGSAVHSS